jgi:uncharacterized membrane protein
MAAVQPIEQRTSRSFETEFATPDTARPRLDSIDLLRGLVMVLMALDHTRDFFTNAHFDPTDLSKTTAALFLTRWVTHFCAPVFTFLAGAGAYLAAARGKTRPQLSWFLLTRGLWLIVLEYTVVWFGITFNFDWHFIPASVLWALGWGMIVLAGLVHLPLPVTAAFAVVTIAGHNLFDAVRPDQLGSLGPLWAVLHTRGPLPLTPSVTMFVVYPLVPWIGVMAAGYVFGAVFLLNRPRRRTTMLGLGASLVLLFVALRAGNFYGDPHPWSPQQDALFTVLSFLNCQKYPPSLLYLLMTLGPALLALSVFERGPGRLGRPLLMFGRVPLFFYLLQWYAAHLLAVVVNAALGRPASWLLGGAPWNAPQGYGYSLGVVYLMWIVVLVLLSPPCRWFAALKRRRRDAWLSYF